MSGCFVRQHISEEISGLKVGPHPAEVTVEKPVGLLKNSRRAALGALVVNVKLDIGLLCWLVGDSSMAANVRQPGQIRFSLEVVSRPLLQFFPTAATKFGIRKVFTPAMAAECGLGLLFGGMTASGAELGICGQILAAGCTLSNHKLLMTAV